MDNKNLKLQLLRDFSMQKHAWYKAVSGGPAPALNEPAPSASEAPESAPAVKAGPPAVMMGEQAKIQNDKIKQNLAAKTSILYTPDPAPKGPSLVTARAKNLRTAGARRVVQPETKAVLASVNAARILQKTAQGRFWNAANTWAEDAQKALGSPMQTLSEGLYEIPGVGRSLRKADAWMGRNVGRDPGTFLSQEVVQPAAQAVAKGLTTKIPGVNASVAEGMEALGQGMIGMPVTTPIGVGLRAGGAELQAAGRAARALPAAGRALGGKALQLGDEFAARALPGLGQDLAYAGAGGRAAGAAESRLPAAVTTLESRAAGSGPSIRPPYSSRLGQAGRGVSPADQGRIVENVVTPAPQAQAAAQADAGSWLGRLRDRLTGGLNSARQAPPADATPKPPSIQDLRKTVARMDVSGQGPGSATAEEMQQMLDTMGYADMGRAERFGRRVASTFTRPLNQRPWPLPGETPPKDLGSINKGLGLAQSAGQGFYRTIPFVGQAAGGPGLFRTGLGPGGVGGGDFSWLTGLGRGAIWGPISYPLLQYPARGAADLATGRSTISEAARTAVGNEEAVRREQANRSLEQKLLQRLKAEQGE